MALLYAISVVILLILCLKLAHHGFNALLERFGYCGRISTVDGYVSNGSLGGIVGNAVILGIVDGNHLLSLFVDKDIGSGVTEVGIGFFKHIIAVGGDVGGIQTPISHAVNVHLHIGGGENQIVHSGSLHSRVSSGNGIHGTTVRAHIIAVLIETRGRSNTPLSVSFGTVAHHGTHNPGSLDIGGDVARTQLGDVVTPVNTNVNDAGVVHILAQLQSLLHLGGVHSQVAIGIKESGVLRVQDGAQHGVVAGKTAKSILISCGARLAPFDIKELRDLMSYDELELDTLGDRKTALFLIMSDTDSTFNFVIAMLQSQLFNLLCDKADDEYGGKLPVHVRCLLDEFANIGQIPQFEKLIATIRSREISASIILQSQSQLKAIYKDAAEIILDNADSTLFLGGRGKNAKDISENLGRETIDSFNTSENRGTQVSHGLNYQKLGKELMTQDEIAVMDGGKCILQLRGVRPFFSDKYDITQHPNYKYLSDFDKKNAFDVERYMSTRPAIVKPDEPFDIYEIDLSDEDAAAE